MLARPRLRSIALLAIGAALVTTAAAARPFARPSESARLPDRLPAATVTVIGRPGSFGGDTGVDGVGGLNAVSKTTASGQSLVRVPAHGWSFPAGHALGPPVVTTDGTVIAPAVTQGLQPHQLSARTMAVVAYHPGTNTFETIALGRSATGMAPGVFAVLPIGDAVVYTVGDASDAGAPQSGSAWPVLGVLSKVDGRWQAGQQWTAADLGLDPRGLLHVVRLPGSGDLFIIRPGGEAVTVRLAGPDTDGRYMARVIARYSYPVEVKPNHIAVDPTRARGDERVAVTLTPAGGGDPPSVLQEYGYDADAGKLWLTSAPLLAGDRRPEDEKTIGSPIYSYDAVAYDKLGNLWVGRHLIFEGGPLAVYRSDHRCPLDGPVGQHRTSLGPGQPTVWGKQCPPDYDIVQGAKLHGATGMAVDPVTGTLMVVTGWGQVLPIRVAAAGSGLAFEMGNAVDMGSTLLPKPAVNWPLETPGAFDSSGRLWIAASQQQLADVPDTSGVAFDQWLYAVDVGDLFDPTPVELPTTPGRTAVVQAERVANFGTSQYDDPQREERPTIVDSDVLVTICDTWPANVGCGYDDTPGNGFAVNDDSGFGHRREPLDYRIRVPAAGDYRVGYFVSTLRELTNQAAIDLIVGDRTYHTAVHTNGDFRMIWAPQPVHLDAGDRTVRLVAPANGEFWYLNSIVFRRA